MRSTFRLILSGVALLVVIILGGIAASDPAVPLLDIRHGSLTIRNPKASVPSGANRPDAVIALFPTNQAAFSSYRGTGRIAAEDDRPIAQFSNLPANLEAIDILLPPLRQGWGPNEEGYTNLASIRYTIAGHKVFVTTYRPSPAAARLSLILGKDVMRLANGVEAGITTDLPPAYAGMPTTSVVQVQDDLILTVAGDLPAEQLQLLATQITIAK